MMSGAAMGRGMTGVLDIEMAAGAMAGGFIALALRVAVVVGDY
jgi:hypothetical protein